MRGASPKPGPRHELRVRPLRPRPVCAHRSAFACGHSGPAAAAGRRSPAWRRDIHAPAPLLMRVLGCLVEVALAIQIACPLELATARSPRRGLAEPTVLQAVRPVFHVTNAQPPELPTRHPKQLASLLRCQPTLCEPSQRLLNSRHEYLPEHLRPPHPHLQNRRRAKRTTHALPTDREVNVDPPRARALATSRWSGCSQKQARTSRRGRHEKAGRRGVTKDGGASTMATLRARS